MSDENIQQLLKDTFLLEDLAILVEQINLQMEEVAKDAQKLGCQPHEIQSVNGEYLMRGLLVAKANALNAIATLKTVGNYAQTLNIYSDISNDVAK